MSDCGLGFGYCTNVHAGTTLDLAKANLVKFAGPVQSHVAPGNPLPVGLWLAENASMELDSPERTAEFADWLRQNQFQAYTLNGFPQGDFHQDVVKHDVYRPTWLERNRFDYTCRLARILSGLIEPNSIGTISTLPLGWPHQPWGADELRAAGEQLLELARFLADLHAQTGREIVVAIEPEPGCVVNTGREVVEFFEQQLFGKPDGELARRYLSVCHDICHSGVMFESQESVLRAYHEAGIRVGKVQVSSAVHVPWDEAERGNRDFGRMLEQLRTFNEPKYLHQATRSERSGELMELCEDLSNALRDWLEPRPALPWRVHFHVPIFVERFGELDTTQGDIEIALKYLTKHQERRVAEASWFTGHLEVETYAWPVLPPSIAEADLSLGIAKELEYMRELFHRIAQRSG